MGLRALIARLLRRPRQAGPSMHEGPITRPKRIEHVHQFDTRPGDRKKGRKRG